MLASTALPASSTVAILILTTNLFHLPLLELNPYAPPEANLAHETEAERIRKAHLATETNIRTSGGVYLFVGFLVGIAGLIRMVTLQPETLMDWGIAFLQFFLGVAFALTGYWLRQFSASTRVSATLLSILSLALIPLGTIVGIYTLYNIHSKRGKLIFTPEYQDILDATPHISRLSSFSCLRIIIIVAIFFAFFATVLILGPMRRYIWD